MEPCPEPEWVMGPLKVKETVVSGTGDSGARRATLTKAVT